MGFFATMRTLWFVACLICMVMALFAGNWAAVGIWFLLGAMAMPSWVAGWLNDEKRTGSAERRVEEMRARRGRPS
jgi:isoprenylcysteine carboxyl methyltransferase (ICMT) family protein YpbQ